MKKGFKTIMLYLVIGTLLSFCFYRNGNAQKISGYEWGFDLVWDGADTSLFDAAPDTILSDPYEIAPSSNFGYYLLVTSTTGTPNVSFETVGCDTKTGTYVVEEDFDPFVIVTDEVPHYSGVFPSLIRYIKIRAINKTGSETDCKIYLRLIFQPPKGR